MMQKNVLEINNLTVSFNGKKGRKLAAVRDVSLTVESGETLGIVGESGSGKSVTIKSIMRLLPQAPIAETTGTICFNQEDVLRMAPERLRQLRGKEIAMVFQNPMTAFNPVLPVGIQIAETLEFHQKDLAHERRRKVVELLEEVGISQPECRAKQYPHEFSGGMLQRAMIASALIGSPQLLLADEPTTGLDVTIQDQILKLMRKMKATRKMSLIWITHDLSLLSGFVDRIAVMYAGKIVEQASAKELYANPLHPYTQGMLSAIPTLMTQRDATLYSIRGLPPNPAALPKGCAFSERCDACMACCKEQPPPEATFGHGRHRVCCWLYANEGKEAH